MQATTMTRTPLQHKLEYLMHVRDYNMKKLSLAAGLNETAVRDILKGRVTNPTYATLYKICTVLGASVDEVAKPETKTINITLSKEELKMRGNVAKLSKCESTIKRLTDIMEADCPNKHLIECTLEAINYYIDTLQEIRTDGNIMSLKTGHLSFLLECIDNKEVLQELLKSDAQSEENTWRISYV